MILEENHERWKLSGKNIVVTGGTKGIGSAIVEECCKLGGKVLTCARNESELNNRSDEWSKKGFQVRGVILDLSSPEQRNVLVEAARSYFDGKVHALVNNVGTNIRNKATSYTEEEYKKIMDTNLNSCFFISQSFYELLRETRNASIINISSVAGGNNIAIRSGVIYAMTKAALSQMSYNLACEWAKDNIRVNAVSPWYINTPLAAPVSEVCLSTRS